MVAADHDFTERPRFFEARDIHQVTQNVYSTTPGMSSDLKRQARGASSTVPFAKEGTAEVQYSIHPK